jgi:UDP-2-acetamido-3-amino-2,3-dideoxy-glucuronate N-acetyltransferase
MTGGPKVGVLGLGHWGPNLLRNFKALGALGAFCDPDAAALEKTASHYPDVESYGDAAKIFADPSLSAVAIATPVVTHGAMVRQALAAGKHVFVEKPLCLDVAEAESLKAEADRRGLVLMVGHLLLYHPAFRMLRDQVRDGVLGPLRYIYSNRLSLGKIRRDENSLWSFAPHDISMILALTGAMPTKVAANASSHLTASVADTSLTHMEFPNNISAHVFVSWLHPYKDHRMIVIGEEAMAVFDDVAEETEKLTLYPHQIGWDGDIPVVRKANGTPIPYKEEEPLRVECTAFLDAVAGRKDPPSDAAEGIRVLRVLNASEEAMESGEAVTLAAAESA